MGVIFSNVFLSYLIQGVQRMVATLQMLRLGVLSLHLERTGRLEEKEREVGSRGPTPQVSPTFLLIAGERSRGATKRVQGSLRSIG